MAVLLNVVLFSTIGVMYSLYIALSLKIPIIMAIMNDNCDTNNDTDAIAREKFDGSAHN